MAGEEEEGYVVEALGFVVDWCVFEGCWVWLWLFEELEDAAAAEVCGFVNSSIRSASSGWCMWRYVAEESLLWDYVSWWIWKWLGPWSGVSTMIATEVSIYGDLCEY